ncbi:MAG: SIMPL domain-containing protein [Chlamydiota bacterium]
MNGAGQGGRHGLTLLGMMLAAGMIVSTIVASRSIEKIKLAGQTIRVKGSSEKRIVSDWAVWDARFTARDPALTAAYKKITQDLEAVLAYLERNGVSRDAVGISSVSTTIQHKPNEKGNPTNVIEGYVLEQSLQVKSADIPLVVRLARDSTSLIQQGIEFSSSPPNYYYTKLNDLKISMLGEATKDARARAKGLAKNSGCKVGALSSASQGVFQITPEYSTEVSDYGVYDTGSVNKCVKALVTMEFSIR